MDEITNQPGSDDNWRLPLDMTGAEMTPFRSRRKRAEIAREGLAKAREILATTPGWPPVCGQVESSAVIYLRQLTPEIDLREQAS